MKLNELPAFRQALEGVVDLPGEKFAYAVFKNIRLSEQAIKHVDKPKEYPKKFNVFETARITLCEEYAKKDDEGKPIIEQDKDPAGNVMGSSYKITNPDEFDVKMTELREEHKTAIAAKKKIDDEYIEYLGSESDVNFHTVEERYLPKEITARQMENLSTMIVFA